MSTVIYYFSGTGNSLYVARELEKRLHGASLVPIVGALRSGSLQTSAETVGVVFPIQALTVPLVVKQFLQRVDLRSAKYVFAVATRFCSDKVFSDMDRILAAQGKALDASFAVEMPCNYIPIFDLPSQSETARMEADLQRRLDEMQSTISARQASRVKDDLAVFLMGRLLYPVVVSWYERVRFPRMARSFYADANCTECGLCERVCLSGRIRLGDRGPEWLAEVGCTYCFACLHFCPAQAIQIATFRTAGKPRYRHVGASVKDVAGQRELAEQG